MLELVFMVLMKVILTLWRFPFACLETVNVVVLPVVISELSDDSCLLRDRSTSDGSQLKQIPQCFENMSRVVPWQVQIRVCYYFYFFRICPEEIIINIWSIYTFTSMLYQQELGLHMKLNLVICILLRVLDRVQGFPMYIFSLEDGRTTETCSG
jgi:hypothetical protein